MLDTSEQEVCGMTDGGSIFDQLPAACSMAALLSVSLVLMSQWGKVNGSAGNGSAQRAL